MPCKPVEGRNPVVVYDAMQEAIDRARSGCGPTLLEIRTYRYKGHSMSDAQKYRTKDEVAEYQKIDPIKQVLEVIKKKKYATDKEVEAIDAKVKALVAECVEFGNNSPFPEGEELWQGVYSEEGYPFIKD